jgi:hypothetical protein
MARYIDADKLNDEYYEMFHHGTMAVKSVLSVFVDLLEKQPTADVVEVKHGEWMPYESEEPYGDESETTWYKCSFCGTDAIGRCYDDEWYSYPIRTDYCPKCGADLRTPKERGGEK